MRAAIGFVIGFCVSAGIAVGASDAVRLPISNDTVLPTPEVEPGPVPCGCPCPPAGPIDTDNDGVPDSQDSDDDGDGMTDIFEREVSKTHPGRPDSDGDGARDDEEYILSKLLDNPPDPNIDDTDEDGWTDGYELEHGTDPADALSNPVSQR